MDSNGLNGMKGIRYVGFHFVVAGPGGFGCIDVETGTGAEVVGVVLAFDA
jgi:hypothetical protein